VYYKQFQHVRRPNILPVNNSLVKWYPTLLSKEVKVVSKDCANPEFHLISISNKSCRYQWDLCWIACMSLCLVMLNQKVISPHFPPCSHIIVLIISLVGNSWILLLQHYNWWYSTWTRFLWNITFPKKCKCNSSQCEHVRLR